MILIGTLAKGNLQDYNFIPLLGMETDEFWEKVDELKKENNMDTTLAYMYLTIKEAKEKGIKLTKAGLAKFGENISFFNGVTTWFKRINEFGKSISLTIRHYIVSSGIEEIIEGTEISKEFERIYACSFLYDENGSPIWPATSVNYTNKTQFLYRISKGVYEIYDDRVNQKMRKEEKNIDFSNMIYIGDGYTDVPSMLIVKNNSGCSIAVYDESEKKNLTEKLVLDERANFSSKADYSNGSELDTYIKQQLIKLSKGE